MLAVPRVSGLRFEGALLGSRAIVLKECSPLKQQVRQQPHPSSTTEQSKVHSNNAVVLKERDGPVWRVCYALLEQSDFAASRYLDKHLLR